MAVCARCGEDIPDRARFCLFCGAPVSVAAPRRGERKTVTLLFCDVTGSTELGERLDPEVVRDLMNRYFATARAAVQRHGGTVEKFIGDAVMAVFGVPVLHDDDALRAVRAAVDISTGLDRLNDELERRRGVRIQVRMGLSTGQVLAGDPAGDGTFVTGDAVNEAARLEQRANPGEILLSDATHRLVRDAVRVEALEPLTVKGKSAPVPAFRVIDVLADSPGHARHLDAPLVGRDNDRLLFTGAFERALRERTCHLFTVLGPAGIGKTRLVGEVVTGLREQALVLSSRCLPYGEDLAFRPLRELVAQAARLSPSDSAALARDKIARQVADEEQAATVADRVAEVIGLAEATAPVEELFWGVRKLLEAVGRAGPLVVVIDDVQWAEATFLDLIEHVADWWQGSPLLVVCLARPELLDDRPGWGGGRMNATSLLLEPLNRAESDHLLANLVEGAPLAEPAAAWINQAADGNPLFVEELLAMLVDDGMLRLVDGRWLPNRDLSAVALPPSIEALLVARLERLPEAERALLERASVVGREFWPAAVVELTPEAERAQMSQLLLRLVRRQLIRYERSTLLGEEGLAFRHALQRDAAYRRLSKHVRSELHERFADFLERAAGDDPDQYDEVLGHHLEQAHCYLAELGPLDDHGCELAGRAARRLAGAGRQALARSDVRAAAGLLRRARALWRENGGGEVDLLTILGEALTRVGDFTGAEEALEKAVVTASALADEGREWHARLGGARLRLWTDPSTGIEAAGTTAGTAIEVFRRLGDELGLAKSSYLLAQQQVFRCQGGESERLLREASGHASAGGDRALELRISAALVSQVPWGPTKVSDGLALCDSVVASAPASRTLEAAVLDGRALFEAMRGRFDEARGLLDRERAVLTDIGDDLLLASAPLTAGAVEMMAGEWAAAETKLRHACRALEALGEKQLLSSSAALLAHALVAQGLGAAADQFSHLSEQSAAADDLLAQVGWRGARAKLLAARGDAEAATRLAAESLDIAERTDFLNMRGDTLMDLAAVLRLGGRGDDAASAARRAGDLYRSKENTASLSAAEAVLRELEGG